MPLPAGQQKGLRLANGFKHPTDCNPENPLGCSNSRGAATLRLYFVQMAKFFAVVQTFACQKQPEG